ncbi:hypothetical protein B9Z55_013478 [Caenorhabditis nigoni]|uniref:Uncharacterized protein n=1 Tax=Caenorhabditis nigoni TaxID=1611254 RepID=A0A2G5U1V8_9PELO|nr:hypothetical protein B9Z55_013478 [Caenorhabditis nigoni]
MRFSRVSFRFQGATLATYPTSSDGLGEPRHKLDKFIVPEAMIQSVSPMAAAAAPSQIVALHQIQALMAIQMQQGNLFPQLDDISKSPTPENGSPSAKRMRLSPNTSNHSDESFASTSQATSGEEGKSPKSCELGSLSFWKCFGVRKITEGPRTKTTVT